MFFGAVLFSRRPEWGNHKTAQGNALGGLKKDPEAI